MDYPKQTIYGVPPSKSNQYEIITIARKGQKPFSQFKKSDKVKAYEKSFWAQCNHYRNKHIDSKFEFYVDVWFETWANDLDGIFKVILDSLQTIEAIKNDNQCIKIVAQKFVDARNPRIEFSIVPIQQQLF